MNQQSHAAWSWATPSPAALEDFERYSADWPRPYFEQAAADLPGLVSRMVKNPAVIAELLIERVRSRTPTSLVRLGDGEGNVLFADQDPYPDLRDFLLRKIGVMQFGHGTDVMIENASLFAQWTREAIEDADFVGAPPAEMPLGGFLCPPEKRDIRSICGNRNAFAVTVAVARTGALSSAAIVPAFISHHLKEHYREILRAAGAIVILGSHDLTNEIRDLSGVQDVRHIPVPMQSLQIKGQINHHFPEAFDRIVSEIDAVAPESLVLVGAGPLAKHYCRLIKARGSIAFDIGSVMDLWAGTSGRGPVTPQMLAEWALH